MENNLDNPIKNVQSHDWNQERLEQLKQLMPDLFTNDGKLNINELKQIVDPDSVNGKSAIEWIMERYAITTHRDSGITNDPNDWAEEVGNPRYVLDLLCSVVEVSVRSVEVVEVPLPNIRYARHKPINTHRNHKNLMRSASSSMI